MSNGDKHIPYEYKVAELALIAYTEYRFQKADDDLPGWYDLSATERAVWIEVVCRIEDQIALEVDDYYANHVYMESIDSPPECTCGEYLKCPKCDD